MRGARRVLPADAQRAVTSRVKGATFALRGVPDILDIAVMSFPAKLNDDVDEQIQQLLDVCAGESPTPRRLLDEEHQLLKGQLGTCGMETVDRARVPRIDVAQVVERFLRAQLREQN